MNEKKEFLTEENYKKGKKKLILLALIVLIIGLTIGGLLLFKGISNSKKVNDTYTEENKQTKINSLNQQITREKTNLETKKTGLISKGVTSSSKYDSGEAYDLYIITKALDPSFSYCSFDEYKNNSLISNYCSLKNQLRELERANYSFEKDWNNFDSIPFYMFGAFIIISTLMIYGSVYMFAKRREIVSFTAQQVMPVAQEGIEKMAPTVGKATEEVAKGITKGIKEGLNKNDNNE